MMKGFFDTLDAFVDATQPTRILEVGLGEGIVSERLRERFPDASIVGIDLADGELGAHWHSRGLAAAFADVEHLPFPDDAFDLVVAIEVFEHFPDPERALIELDRVASAAPRRLRAVRTDLAPRQHGQRPVPARSRQHPRARQPLEPARILPVRRPALDGRRRRQPAAVDDGSRHERREDRPSLTGPPRRGRDRRRRPRLRRASRSTATGTRSPTPWNRRSRRGSSPPWRPVWCRWR